MRFRFSRIREGLEGPERIIMPVDASQSVLPEKCRILSGSALKMIAMITMLLDHIGSILLSRYSPALQTLFVMGETNISVYRIFRDVGRMAFPLFGFLLVEGFLHTHDRFKYGRNLFFFALLSEIPWNYWHNETLLYGKSQNVYFTLLLGYLAFCALDYFRDKGLLQLACILALLWISVQLGADYGWKGYVFLLILYALREDRLSQSVIGSCWLYYEWKAFVAFIWIHMYNGERGFIRGKGMKYVFYAFYPVHIVLLVILRKIIFG
ncbi:MAG: conjugal transfer protein TraX [Clostridiales bacterium]|nr:conjugal transfer protein TraX [Clostridiales bacterium]